ncbi:hypothetical protein [Leptolyngbya sp. FACHB-17]|uniref:hypothetical protein n=1 Tax=unclassified Leptolyngbya TaxID=2650499 RepID=UPI0016814A0E|nr:hypothetical protein [Leptolyngbya sp. FACHB-17]MBD2083224.1 hypothetical protein [Leptolyngbya sp. FACHB-17]
MFFKVLVSLIHWFQPFLVPTCFTAAWALVLSMAWRTFEITRDTVKQAKQMHQIPCADCQFFTGDYNLKCPVHPMTALSEDAIACPDYYER